MRSFVKDKSQNFAKYHRILYRFAYEILFNFAKFGPLLYGIRNKKKHRKYTKFLICKIL